MRVDELTITRANDGTHGPLTLLLSLNLIILSLFIMLNSVVQQTGGQPEPGNVNALADGGGKEERAGANGADRAGQWLQPDSGHKVQGVLQGMVVNGLRIANPMLRADARGLVLAVPQSVLFDGNAAAVSVRGKTWLENLKAMLETTARGWDGRLRLEGRTTDAALLAARVVAVNAALGNAPIDIGFTPTGEAAFQPRVVLSLRAPEGVQTGRRVEQLQRGLSTGERNDAAALQQLPDDNADGGY